MTTEDLWRDFESRLNGQDGVAVADIAGCAPTVLQALLVELGFSTLQVAKLQTMWTRRFGAAAPAAEKLGASTATAITAPPPRVPPTFVTAGSAGNNFGPVPASILPVASQAAEHSDIAQQARAFLCGCMGVASSSSGQDVLSEQYCTITAVSRVISPTLDALHANYRSKMVAGERSRLMWRFVKADAVDRICGSGLDPVRDLDPMCPCGLVFYGVGFPATEGSDHSLNMAAVADGGEGFKLVLCEVATGEPRPLFPEDASLLAHFSSEQCGDSLREEGFGCVAIRYRDATTQDAVVVFHPHQAIPRYLIGFTTTAAIPQRRGEAQRALALAAHGDNGNGSLAAGCDFAASPMFCTSHPTKRVEFWSTDEKRLLCSLCMYVDGYGQRPGCVLIDEGAAQEREGLLRWVKAVDGFARDVGSVMVAFETALERCQSDAAAQITGVRRAMGEVRDCLNAIEARVVSNLENVGAEQALALQRSLTNVVTLVSDVETIADAGKRALRGNAALEILAAQQAAMREWPPVNIPLYTAPTATVDAQAILDVVSRAVREEEVEGPVDLPECIDANNLHADATGMSGSPMH